MSEEIIINGIDVSECEFYEEMRELPDNLNGGYYIQHCYCGLQGDNYCICNKNPDCYFKQLKRLEQENKEKINILEQIINILYPNANDDELYDVAFNSEYIDKLKELIKSNERLQKENEDLKAEIDRQKDTITYLQNYDMCHKILIQYKQTLEEIRSYCEEQNLKADYTACEILSIIDKVLDEN